MGRNTSGVQGMTLGKDDAIVDMVIIKNTHEATVLAISENGFGKRSLVDDYREQSRGGRGGAFGRGGGQGYFGIRPTPHTTFRSSFGPHSQDARSFLSPSSFGGKGGKSGKGGKGFARGR